MMNKGEREINFLILRFGCHLPSLSKMGLAKIQKRKSENPIGGAKVQI